MNVYSGHGIIVTFKEPGMHQWKNPPETAKYGKLLENLHRHLFHFVLKLSTDQADRQFEFLEVRDTARKLLRPFLYTGKNNDISILNFKEMSCEAIAEFLGKALEKEYPGVRAIVIEVWEDGENGGYYHQTQVPDEG